VLSRRSPTALILLNNRTAPCQSRSVGPAIPCWRAWRAAKSEGVEVVSYASQLPSSRCTRLWRKPNSNPWSHPEGSIVGRSGFITESILPAVARDRRRDCIRPVALVMELLWTDPSFRPSGCAVPCQHLLSSLEVTQLIRQLSHAPHRRPHQKLLRKPAVFSFAQLPGRCSCRNADRTEAFE
jgi:hypothetical protein